MQLVFTALSIFFLTLFYLSYRRVKSSGDTFGFIYQWAFWLGAFVWEDLMVFSLYHAVATILALALRDLRVLLLMVGVFWVVRSAGEAIYFFLQQFHLPKHYPHELHNFLQPVRRIFGDISDQKSYIIMQILHQSIAMSAAAGLILLLLNWERTPLWL